MLLRRFTDYLLQNRLNACLMALLFGLFSFIGAISIVIVALVTLRKGFFEGAIVLIVSLAPYVIFTFFLSSQEDLVVGALNVYILSSVLTWLCAGWLATYGNWSVPLQLAALLAGVAILIAHQFDVQHWWVGQFGSYLNSKSDLADKMAPFNWSVDAKAKFASEMALYASGIFAVAMLLNAFLQLVVARWWQAVIFNPGGLRPELYKIRLSYVAGVVFAGCLLLRYFENSTVLDILPVLFFIFVIAGLSLLHQLATLTKSGWAWIILLYGLMLYMYFVGWFFYVVLAVASVAFCDIWFNVRKRFGLAVN